MSEPDMHCGPTQTENEGAWIVYSMDWHKLVKTVFNDELLAHRWADDNYGEVEFVTFGQEIQ